MTDREALQALAELREKYPDDPTVLRLMFYVSTKVLESLARSVAA